MGKCEVMDIKMNILAFEVTRRCNQSCAHCCKGPSQNIDMSKECIDSLFRNDHYKISQISYMAITGGETTLVPSLITYLIDTIIELDIAITRGVNCFTNGLLYEQDIIDSLQKLMKHLKQKKESQNVNLVFEVSNDQFHKRPSKEILEKYAKVPFLDKSFLKPRTRTIERTQNDGNAKENGIGGILTYRDFLKDISIKREKSILYVDGEILIAANGNVIGVGCAPFIEEDKISLGNISNNSLLEILEKPSLKEKTNV